MLRAKDLLLPSGTERISRYVDYGVICITYIFGKGAARGGRRAKVRRYFQLFVRWGGLNTHLATSYEHTYKGLGGVGSAAPELFLDISTPTHHRLSRLHRK